MPVWDGPLQASNVGSNNFTIKGSYKIMQHVVVQTLLQFYITKPVVQLQMQTTQVSTEKTHGKVPHLALHSSNYQQQQIKVNY